MAESSKKPLIVIAGPTASGKTSLSIAAAKALSGEIISADSMQIYKGLDIGTAKATAEERAIVPHHLVDIVDPSVVYSAANFVSDAEAAISDIISCQKVPIVCGGTGFYIDSFVNGAEFDDKGRDDSVRSRLSERAESEGLAVLYSELQRLDPVYASSIHENDAKRIIRGLEIFETTGAVPTEHKSKLKSNEPKYNLLYFVLAFENRQLLYDRIEKRIDEMVSLGVLDEARIVFENKDAFATASQAIGYKEFFPYFEGTADLSSCIDALKTATRRYAKRQISWFKRSEYARTLFIDNMSGDQLLECIVDKARNAFLNN